jgi:hypothetical protein
MIPRAELQRAELLNVHGEATSPGGELVRWEDLFERERGERAEAEEVSRQLERDLIAIVNAGPIRALRLQRRLRRSAENAVELSPVARNRKS